MSGGRGITIDDLAKCWRLGMNRYSLFFLWVFLPGCIGTIWQQYETPDYGISHADQICHPYGFCSQGKWVTTARAKGDPIPVYMACRDETGQLSGEWSEISISVGLEAGHCMRSKGYQLSSQ